MGDITKILNCSKEGILSHLSAINVTGSNIANVDTPGYTRLRPVFSSTGTKATGDIQIGVEISTIQRIYDKFLDSQIVKQEQIGGYTDAQYSYLRQIETIFNESSENGLNDAMNNFWNAWEDLSLNPSGQAEREALVAASNSLTLMFRQKSDQLTELQDDINSSIPGTVDEINSITSKVAQYNYDIMNSLTGGASAGDLQDKRANLLNDLAALTDFSYLEDSDGSISVFLADGRPLVEGDNIWQLGTRINASNGSFYDVIYAQDGSSLNSLLTGGKLAGYLEIRDEKIDGYLSDFDTLATGLADAVNARHRLGYDSYGNAGEDFFEFTGSVRDAAHLQVSSSISGNSGLIAASGGINSDGENATAVGALKDALLMDGSLSSFNTFYSSFVGRIGQDVNDLKSTNDRQTAILSQLQDQRETVSGVSLDEEMMNLMKFQMGYNAAGKLAATAEELMDTLMDMVS
jgi:flagellar hook-associated protein 1 FlgK